MHGQSLEKALLRRKKRTDNCINPVLLICVRATILIQFRTPIKKVRTPEFAGGKEHIINHFLSCFYEFTKDS